MTRHNFNSAFLARLTLYLVVAVQISCARSLKLAKPEWYTAHCSTSATQQALTFCTEAVADTEETAIKQAFTQALAQAASQLATTVQETVQINSECVEIDKNGIDTTRCVEAVQIKSQSRSAEVTFRGVKLAKKQLYTHGTRYHAFIQIRIPQAEWNRLQVKLRGQSLLLVECDLDGHSQCPIGLVNSVRHALLACGVQPVQTTGRMTETDTIALQHLAKVKQASQVVRINLKSRIATSQDGLFKGVGRGSWSIVDAFDGQVIAARTLPPQTHVTTQRQTAVGGAFRLLPKQLTATQCGLTQSTGSLCCALNGPSEIENPRKP
ncbi:MAG: hypothetical protein VYA30_02040 [Myxococcota bacterium]|nr:hypothetical protein [Myxococcota bacterium]